MNKNGEEEENRPHKIVRKKEEEDEHRDVTNQFNKNMSFQKSKRILKNGLRRYLFEISKDETKNFSLLCVSDCIEQLKTTTY